MNPGSGFFNDVKDNRFFMAAEDDVFYFFGDMVDVVPGDASDGFDLIFDGSERVLLGELEHEVDLVLHLVANVGFTEYIEFIRSSFLDNLEFI